jgi:sugar (pentulose or hexulose) kinase
MSLILSIDCGTQSLRALIFDSKGNLLAKEKVEYDAPYYSSHLGWAEKDPEDYYQALCKATNDLVTHHPDLCGDIAGIVITAQRDTSVLVDKDGKPLRDAILWLDQREASCHLSDHFNPVEIAAYKAVGMSEASFQVMRKSKAYWVRENEPEIWKKTHKFLLLSGYLHFKLTGEFTDSISNCVGHIPFKVKKFGYPSRASDISYRQFGVEREKLAKLIPAGDTVGVLTDTAAREMGIAPKTPVIAGASDKSCETLACGCTSEDCACLSLGTTATVQITTKKYIEPIRFIPPYPAAIKDYYNPEYEVFRGYWLISWFKKEFAEHEVHLAAELGVSTETVLDEYLSTIAPGSDGLILQPYWTAGLKMKDAKGCMIGFSDVHTRAHIYKAIIEGVNYGLMEGIERIEGCTGVPIKNIYVSGGGAQSSSICQVMADMMGRPVYRAQTYETSGLGAAIIGYTALGVHASFEEAVKKMIRYSKSFEPNVEQSRFYGQIYQSVYKKIFKTLKPLYASINTILGSGEDM